MCREWLAKNKNPLQAAAAIAATLSLAIGAGSLIVAAYQAQRAATTLEAATLYQIQKDGRDLFRQVSENPAYQKFVMNFNPNVKYDEDLKREAELRIGMVLQYFSAISKQFEFSALSDRSRASWDRDLCDFVTRQPVKTVWQEKFARSELSDNFKQQVNACLGGSK